MKARLFLAALGALVLLHQDVWLWEDPRLMFGFLPSGLAYHAAYSLATAALWLLAIRYVWPSQLGEIADSSDGDGNGPT